jgi:hypothetical protein
VPKLYSFLNERKLIENWDDSTFLMVDSGAHSWNKDTITTGVGMKRKTKIRPAKEFIETYFDFISQFKDKKVVFVEFDVYGHLSKEQIDEFANRVSELNGCCKFLRVYHPILDNGSLDLLRQWMDEGHEYIGIGNDSSEMLDKIFAVTRDKVRLHGFAMTKLWMMEKYPFYSVDSTSPLSTVIFGRYTTPVMAFKERAHIIEERSVECFHQDHERIRNAVIEVAKTQDYITALWAKKGIKWQDLKW